MNITDTKLILFVKTRKNGENEFKSFSTSIRSKAESGYISKPLEVVLTKELLNGEFKDVNFNDERYYIIENPKGFLSVRDYLKDNIKHLVLQVVLTDGTLLKSCPIENDLNKDK